MSTTQHNDVILTIAEEKELALMDTDGDDRISAEEARAAVKSSAKLSVSTSRLWKIVAVVNFMVAVANLMMEDFMQAVVKLSKELLNGAAPTVAEPATALIEPDAVLAEHHAALAQPAPPSPSPSPPSPSPPPPSPSPPRQIPRWADDSCGMRT